jgi:hypothetical protein
MALPFTNGQPCSRHRGRGMEEILKPFKDFLTRDVIFITGGSLIISTVIYIRGLEIDYEKIPLPIYIVIALLGHSIGFAIMQLFNGLRIINITTIQNPNTVDRLIYRIFARRKWDAIRDHSGATWLAATPLPRDQAEKDRIITLKHIGATIGPCAFVSGVLLTLATIIPSWSPHEIENWTIFAAFALASVLIPVSRSMAGLQAQFDEERFSRQKTPPHTHKS